MKNRPFALGVATAFLLGASVAAHAEKQDLIKKSFKVSPGSSLVMKVDRGNIEIKTGNTDTAEVEVLRKVPDGQASSLDEHKVDISQSGNEIKITAERPGGLKRGFGFFNGGDRLQVAYTITLPKAYNLKLQTSGGSVNVGDIKGKVDIGTSGGNIRMAGVEGPVFAHTSGGSISLEKSSEKTQLETSGGNIHLGKTEGDLLAKTSGGSIHIEKAGGTTVAETTGGNIDLDGVSGAVTASTSGGSITAKMLTAPKSACALKTSGGNIRLALNGTAPVSVDARTSGGNVRSDFGKSDKDRSHWKGDLNGGGPKVDLVTSGGSVTISKL